MFTELIAQSGECCGQWWEQNGIFSSDSILLFWRGRGTLWFIDDLFTRSWSNHISKAEKLFFYFYLLCLVCDCDICVDVTVDVFPEIMSGEWQAVSSSSHGQPWPAVDTRVSSVWHCDNKPASEALSPLNVNLSELKYIWQHVFTSTLYWYWYAFSPS